MNKCQLCPRNCQVDRTNTLGYCQVPSELKVARAALHMWEEPCISGTHGSGTIFFSGCSLGCVFCQNNEISRGKAGAVISSKRLQEICMELKDQGAENINLVTPMHYARQICEAIEPIKEELGIPIVCNTGGYDLPEAICTMGRIADCYLPDYKFADESLAKQFCHASDYPDIVHNAIKAMILQTGKPKLNEQGILQSGVLVRHLIIPGCRKDSMRILDILNNDFGTDNILISLMSQYTPQPNASGAPTRRITEFEYHTVVEYALKLGFKGYMQDRSSASHVFTPAFDLTGVYPSSSIQKN
ncbi:MAG: radical SAM protein [Ruminococcaceae bacterium]|nr:radical SAM protein [Oscillospiraceae bacterium]